MAFPDPRRPCAKCKTAGGIATCDGCHQSFCNNHLAEHQQALASEMDDIGQNYDLLRRDMLEETGEHSLLSRINVWEEESIERIQQTAQNARLNLQIVHDHAKKTVEEKLNEIIGELRRSRDDKDYLEKDFQRWNEQLTKLRQTFECLLDDVMIENDNHEETIVNLIKVSQQQTIAPSSSPNERPIVNEKFDPAQTDAVLSGNNFIAIWNPRFDSSGAFLYGFNSYSSGVNNIAFRIERRGVSRIFFGIFSSTKKRIRDISLGNENSVYGWWDIDSLVLNGIKHETSPEQILSTGDKILLTLDCDHQQLQLNRQLQLPVNVNKCPFPWKIIIKLTSRGDCISIVQ